MNTPKKQSGLATEAKAPEGNEVNPEESQPADDSVETSDVSTPDIESALAEAQEKYIRLAAEFENFKKRTARERLELINAANDNLLLKVLETVDNFERALDSAEKVQRDADPQKGYNALHEGAKMIHQQLLAILRAQGVEEIETDGSRFDPTLHEAVLRIETDDYPEDHIAQVISKGYKRGERVLRHSQVGVASKKRTRE